MGIKRNQKRVFGLLVAAAIGLAACGGDDGETTASADQPDGPTAVETEASVEVADSSLGPILVDADGNTLYAFTKDTNGESTCFDSCADAWPAATIDGDAVAGDGVTATLSTVDAPEGGTMVVAGDWPLYRFAGDSAPGDVNGQGSGGVWFVVAAGGTLVKE